jgi:hypothetical protein
MRCGNDAVEQDVLTPACMSHHSIRQPGIGLDVKYDPHTSGARRAVNAQRLTSARRYHRLSTRGQCVRSECGLAAAPESMREHAAVAVGVKDATLLVCCGQLGCLQRAKTGCPWTVLCMSLVLVVCSDCCCHIVQAENGCIAVVVGVPPPAIPLLGTIG